MISSNQIPRLKKEAKNDPKKKQIQIIGQGTYGCVFRPELTCKTQTPGSNEYVTKIQVRDRYSLIEVDIGKIIQRIPFYQYYYAPIIRQCDVNLATIDQHQIRNCKVITKELHSTSKNRAQFISNKIQYVGNQTHGMYFESLLTSETKRCKLSVTDQAAAPEKSRMSSCIFTRFLSKIAETHLYLLYSIHQLNEHDVIHLDIKENNIVYDKKNDVFKMIDFGLSSQISVLQPEQYVNSKRPFGISTEHYAPWSVEIILLSYIAKQVQNSENQDKSVNATKFEQEKITKSTTDIMKRYCSFTVNSPLLKSPIFTSADRTDFEKRLHLWVDSFENKTWKAVWILILASVKTWDNYGLTVMYIHELEDSNMDVLYNSADAIQIGPLNEYVDILKRVILAEPSKRQLPMETAKEIRTTFQRVNKKEYMLEVQTLHSKILNRENIMKIQKNKKHRTLQGAEQDKFIRMNHR